MFLNAEQLPLEAGADVEEKITAIDERIRALILELKWRPDDVDLMYKLMLCWWERFECRQDEISFSGSEYYYYWLARTLDGSNASMSRKLREFGIGLLDSKIERLEVWLSEWGHGHYKDVPGAREYLSRAKREKAELLAEQKKEEVLVGSGSQEGRAQFW